MTRTRLLLGPLSLVWTVAACGGAVSPVGDSALGGGAGSGSGGASSDRGVACVARAPACDAGHYSVGSSSSACPQDAACYSRSNACGTKIWCAEGIAPCPAVRCEAGYDVLQVATCPVPPGPPGNDIDCHTVTVCGNTFACMRRPIDCEGPRPMCTPGDVEVTTPNLCPADRDCYSRSVCNFTIWCYSGVDGGPSAPASP